MTKKPKAMASKPNGSKKKERVLAIDPTSVGVAFAVFESPDRLIDWGLKHLNRDPRLRFRRIERMIDRFMPDALVFERINPDDRRRPQHVTMLLRAVENLARKRRVRVVHVPRAEVRAVFAPAASKDQIGAAIAIRYRPLARHLPRVHTVGMSRNQYINIFDAAAAALTYLYRSKANAESMTWIPVASQRASERVAREVERRREARNATRELLEDLELFADLS